MKKLIIPLIILTLALASCIITDKDGNVIFGPTNTPKVSESPNGQPDETPEPTPEPTPKETFTNDNLDALLADPDGYKGAHIEFSGQVFNIIESKGGETLFQVRTGDLLTGDSIAVRCQGNVRKDDYVKVTGTVAGSLKGENLLEGTIKNPLVAANNVEVVDYVTAISPAIYTLEVDKSINQHGLKVILEKIEIAKSETRVYLKATNNSDEDASVYEFSANIIQGSKQYETEYNFSADYPEFPTSIRSGVEAEAILSFKPIEPADCKFIIEGRNDDYMLDFEPYEFDIKWND